MPDLLTSIPGTTSTQCPTSSYERRLLVEQDCPTVPAVGGTQVRWRWRLSGGKLSACPTRVQNEESRPMPELDTRIADLQQIDPTSSTAVIDLLTAVASFNADLLNESVTGKRQRTLSVPDELKEW